jgi:hypothetical protein
MKAGAAIIFLILITVWAGVIIGVSLIATPVKFQAPSLTLLKGTEIGRYTFRLPTRIELCFWIAALVSWRQLCGREFSRYPLWATP